MLDRSGFSQHGTLPTELVNATLVATQARATQVGIERPDT
jgi:hypothetical protein